MTISCLVDIIVSSDSTIRNQSLAEYCNPLSEPRLLEECDHLERFRRSSTNLYERVRACFFLYAIHRFYLPRHLPDGGGIPYIGYKCLQERMFEDAIKHFLEIHQQNPSVAISSSLAKGYYHIGFQTLADQVRLSVKNHPGNAWMFQVQLPRDHPKSIRPELLQRMGFLQEQTPVRMDLSHCGWSDIFFLGMDYPEGARVLNVSIDLAVRGRHEEPVAPIDTFLRVIDEPVLVLTSIDLKSTVTLTHISQVFDFGKDYLGLLRAGIISSGIVPLGLEGSNAPLSDIFRTTIAPGRGLHLITRVNDIPKGSRLAVSTNLLGSIIAVAMRATGQTESLLGTLTEEERRLVAARAILGEWLGGSGGGWQDSGGLWPGIKLIQGVTAQPDDPEHGTSRGRLLPMHRTLSDVEAPPDLIQALQEHLVLVHGGMAQNVGPVLEMVTEKYLLREKLEWEARNDALGILDSILEAFQQNDIPKLAKLTTRNFFEPLQTIIPWASNLYTETLIERTRAAFGENFLGFWMLGGCSGGGMGFIFKPKAKREALVRLLQIMLETKREMEHALPFSMDPVVYDFAINRHGTRACWYEGEEPTFLKTVNGSSQVSDEKKLNDEASLDKLLEELRFDHVQHETIRQSYKTKKIGLQQNRLPLETVLSDAPTKDLIMAHFPFRSEVYDRGMEELRQGRVGVVTLAAGVGSRWTQGAGCVKAIHPFCKISGKHRTFLEIHLAKSRRISEMAGVPLPHIITTSFMTDSAVRTYLERVQNHAYKGPLYLSKGACLGVRLIPTIDDLDFAHQQLPKVDEQAHKVRESGHRAVKEWAETCGEASDYRDNLPLQCLHPLGHWWEIPNLLLNGTLANVLRDRPQLTYLMLHNIDTVGADVDPNILGLFLGQDSTLGFEVIPRQIQDVGGGLASVNGKTRLMEGLALPREEDEFKFRYYNSMTTWIHIDRLLKVFGLVREDLFCDNGGDKLAESVRRVAARMPTYVALKEVKKRWGNGQEDVFPTVQFEQLWSDMSGLEDVDSCFLVVPRTRGGQLKDVSQLDGWLRDGSAKHLETICSWPPT